MSDLPLTLTGLTVEIVTPESSATMYGQFEAGIAVGRTMVDGNLRHVVLLKSPEGGVMMALMDEAQADDFAGLYVDEVMSVGGETVQ